MCLPRSGSQQYLPQLLALICLLVGGSLRAAETRPQRPNVLFIAIDDLNDWVGCLGGHPQAHTPNIDALAARGTLFTNAHCQAPLCNPSRASIMTGLRPSTTGIYGLKPGHPRVRGTENSRHAAGIFWLPRIFHLHLRQGVSRWVDCAEGPAARISGVGTCAGDAAAETEVCPYTGGHSADGLGRVSADDEDQADWKICSAAVKQLETLPAGKPFFVACGFRLPHVPCFASQKWFDLIPENVILPDVRPDERTGVPFFAWYLHWKLPEPRLSWLKRTTSGGRWCGLIWRPPLSWTARSAGSLPHSSTGRADNTIIVLWSDNGWHLGEKLITGKNSLWEQSTHIPLIFAGSGIEHGARCARPAELLDMYPTLVDLCGLPPRTGLEGHSLVPQLKDATSRARLAGHHHVESEQSFHPHRALAVHRAMPMARKSCTTINPIPASGTISPTTRVRERHSRA